MGVSYLTSVPGMIKLAEEVFNFIGFMCIACRSAISAKGDAFLAASVGAFIITAILLIVYVLDVQERVGLPWVKIQFFYCVLWGLFYLITSALIIDEGHIYYYKIDIAGGVFGLFATAMYFVDAFFKYKTQD